MVEVAGLAEARQIVNGLGWKDYHAVVSNWSRVTNSAFQGLEAVVVSKIAIDRAVELDASPDGHHASFGAGSMVSRLPAVSEQAIKNTSLPTLGAFTNSDRGSMRVDLANGLTIFPVHLKSNRNNSCIGVDNAIGAIRSQDSEVADRLKAFFENGFRKATDDHLKNARKRERMMAAVLVEANKAVAEGRKVLITGDFNVAFEPGKSGTKFEDCPLKDFSCRKAPFPKKACRGDGFDDTLAILERPLIGTQSWTFLSRNLDRTFEGQEVLKLGDRSYGRADGAVRPIHHS